VGGGMMARAKYWIPLVLLLAVGALAVFRLSTPRDDFVHSQMVGQKLPVFAMPAALDGTPGLTNIDFADGTPRLLNIFASWCIPCRAEAAQLETLKKAGVQIYGVALPDRPDDPYKLANFIAEFGNPYARAGLDTDMQIQLALGSSGVPETYVIGGDGTIVYQHIGDIRAEDVPALMARLKGKQ
jgi:cytochrome c biogenesis protein CcmG/thiol:disulfide interchange protein DsbE